MVPSVTETLFALGVGGRVVGVTSVRETLSEAIGAAYERVTLVSLENGYCRRDIGRRALAALSEKKGE